MYEDESYYCKYNQLPKNETIFARPMNLYIKNNQCSISIKQSIFYMNAASFQIFVFFNPIFFHLLIYSYII